MLKVEHVTPLSGDVHLQFSQQDSRRVEHHLQPGPATISKKRGIADGPHALETPAKKQSKWSPAENAVIIELRASGMKWEDISKKLPGRSAISCRLHYQNFLERKPDWDDEKKNKLARLYERFKDNMWKDVAKELQMPWRAVEAMHWQIGAQGMADRAGVAVFSTHPPTTSQPFIKNEPGQATSSASSHLAPPFPDYRRSNPGSPHQGQSLQSSYPTQNQPPYPNFPAPGVQAHQPQHAHMQQAGSQLLAAEGSRPPNVVLAPKYPSSAFPSISPHQRENSRPRPLSRHMSQPNLRSSRDHLHSYPPPPGMPRRPSPTHSVAGTSGSGHSAAYDDLRLPPIPASGAAPGVDDDGQRPRLPPLRMSTGEIQSAPPLQFDNGRSQEDFRPRHEDDTFRRPSHQSAESRESHVLQPPQPPPPPAGGHIQPPSPTRRPA